MAKPDNQTKNIPDTLIVGGGLAGLSLAHSLHKQGLSFVLAEARDRFGGRILGHTHLGADFDLGPAWFWPGQPRLAALLGELGLEHFEQYYRGNLVYEDQSGPVQTGRGFASMQGSWRVQGGMGAMIDGLLRELPKDQLQLSCSVDRIQQKQGFITATTSKGMLTAKTVALAVPPRVVHQAVEFEPPLPDTVLQQLQNVPTWMAGQAKAVAIYETPFWREAGLSGDASSRRGPMVEVHDASPASGGPYGLFGFIGVPFANRQDTPALQAAIIAQLGRLFGPKAEHPLDIVIKDWANDPFTATSLDHAAMTHHPSYGMPADLQNLWDNRMVFAGTEVAQTFGGYLEGALEASDAALSRLLPTLKDYSYGA